MAAKRGTSGLSLVVGVLKPSGMSSHDVVNICRRAFGERRVGHTGTLDPLATGVLPICVGPATRLSAYLTDHDKHYRVGIAFGASTDTDDAAGEVIRTGIPPYRLEDESVALDYLHSIIGPQKQLPPTYSAIKVNGVKSYDAARSGTIIDLMPRDIEVYDARLNGIRTDDEQGYVIWDVSFHVSKGTYIRSLARDAGLALGCPAHVLTLERTRVGGLDEQSCVTVEQLRETGKAPLLDPIALLEVRFLKLPEDQRPRIVNGCKLSARNAVLFERRGCSSMDEACGCLPTTFESERAPEDGEIVAIVIENAVQALYQFSAERKCFKPACVFPVAVQRG